MTTEQQQPPWSSAAEPVTRWTNPTQHTIRFELAVMGKTRRTFRFIDESEVMKTRTVEVDHVMREVVVAPGESVELPSLYDRGIHLCTCTLEACKHSGAGQGPWCKDPQNPAHKATVMAGLAPLLQREGQVYAIHPSLVVRPEAPRAVGIAPGDVAEMLRREEDDPTLQRARERRAAKAGGK